MQVQAAGATRPEQPRRIDPTVRRRDRRRRYAFLVALTIAFVLIVADGTAHADDWYWLRILCAQWQSWHDIWVILGCAQVPPLPPVPGA
jgi:hypothetical protein